MRKFTGRFFSHYTHRTVIDMSGQTFFHHGLRHPISASFRKHFRYACIALALAGVYGAVVSAQTIPPKTVVIETPWSRATAPGATVGVGYLTLRNTGGTSQVLTQLESPLAERVEIHSMSMEGGRMQMRQLPRLELTPGKTVRLGPGGLHLMLLGLKKPLVAGEKLSLTLRFASGQAVTVEMPIAPLGATQPPPDR